MARILAVVGALALVVGLYLWFGRDAQVAPRATADEQPTAQASSQPADLEPSAVDVPGGRAAIESFTADVATEEPPTAELVPDEFEPWPPFGVGLVVLRADTRAAVPFATVDVIGSRDGDESALKLASRGGSTIDDVWSARLRRFRADASGRVVLPFGDPRSRLGLVVLGRADGLIGFGQVPVDVPESELVLVAARVQVVKVVDAVGAPVAGATVVAGRIDEDGEDWTRLFVSATDATGCARFEAEPLLATAHTPVQFRTATIGATAATTIVSHEQFGTEELVLVLEPSGSLEFVFTGEARVPHLTSVMLIADAAKPFAPPLALARAVGRSFVFDDVVLGREFTAAVAFIASPAAEPFVVRGPTSVGERVVIEIPTRPVLFEFEGRVLTSLGAPLANEPIVVERAPSARITPRTSALDVVTDGDGRFFVSASLAADGAADLRVVVPRTGQRSRPVRADSGPQQSASLIDIGDFTLADDAFAATLVVRMNGEPVPGLRFDVAVEIAESDGPYGDLTEFRWFGLPPASEGCRWSAARDVWSTSDADGRIELQCHAVPLRIAVVCAAFDEPLRGMAVAPFLNEVVVDLAP